MVIPILSAATKPIANLVREKPIVAIFEVCLRCNSDCQYCNLPLNQGRYELSREEIRRVFSSLYRDGIRFLFISGGESLLRRDLPEILEDLAAIGFHLTLNTNGTLLTKKLVERFAKLPLHIAVSLDTLDRNRYKQIRGADLLLQTLKGIEALADFPKPKSIVCIVSEVNRDDVLEVAKFARDRNFIPVIGAYHWEVEKYGKVSHDLQYQKQTAIEVFEAVLKSDLVPRGYFRDYVKDNVRWLSNKSLEPCDAGRYSIAIDASGNVAPCLALESAGNLLQSSLEDILAKFDRQSIQQCSEKSSCNMLCARVVRKNLRHPVSGLMSLYPSIGKMH